MANGKRSPAPSPHVCVLRFMYAHGHAAPSTCRWRYVDGRVDKWITMWITRRRSLARMDSPASRGIMIGMSENMSEKQMPLRYGKWDVTVGSSAGDSATPYVLAAGRLPRCGRCSTGLARALVRGASMNWRPRSIVRGAMTREGRLTMRPVISTTWRANAIDSTSDGASACRWRRALVALRYNVRGSAATVHSVTLVNRQR